MKKVMCVDGVKIGNIGTGSIYGYILADAEDVIYEGETYTVIDECNIKGEPGYILKERPLLSVYRKRRFIPLSEISETEMIRERQYETITNESTK